MKNDPLQEILLVYTEKTRALENAYAALEQEFLALKSSLSLSHKTLENLVAHMSDGLIFIDNEAVVTLLNGAAGEIIGCCAEKIVHRPFQEMFADGFFGFSMKEALACSTHRRAFITLDDEHEIEVSLSPIPGQGVLLLLSNRKERKALETSFEQSQRLKELGEMAATLAHEIRNPLGGIEGFAQLLKRDLESPSHQRMIKAILEGTKTLNALVTQVLDYAKPLQLHLTHTDLVALVHETLEFAAVFSKAACRFTTAPSHFFLMLDHGLVKGVLLNLIRNAEEAQATTILLHLDERGILSIKDNGVGIAQKSLKKIFTPFFTTKTQGTGLGLAKSLAVMKAHGGTLEVFSEEGKGAQFRLKFLGQPDAD